MGPSETTFTDPLTRSPRPWVEIVSSLYHAAGGAGGPGSPMAAAAGSMGLATGPMDGMAGRPGRAMEKADQEKARQVERSSKLPARKRPERDYGPSR